MLSQNFKVGPIKFIIIRTELSKHRRLKQCCLLVVQDGSSILLLFPSLLKPLFKYPIIILPYPLCCLSLIFLITFFNETILITENIILMSLVNSEILRQFVQQHFESSAIPSLIEYIKIDNLSRTFDPEWETNGKLDKAASHIKDWVLSLKIEGLTSQIIKHQGFSPIIFTEVKGDVPHTLFFYGHYDKQPPFTGWMEGIGPTNPKIIDGKLYGRGGADDGYSTYSTMLGIKALQDQGVPLPRCVMITEGDEESGSLHVFHYLQSLKERIGQPYAIFCLDSGTLDYDRMWLSTSIRGNMVATLKVQTNLQGLHSGSYSGVVPSCFRVARILFNRLQDYKTGQINPKFHTSIPPVRYRQFEQLAKLLGSKIYEQFPFYSETQPISKNPLECLLKRNWYPTVTVTGQTGFPEAQIAGNILIPELQMRFSIRLPPNFPVEKAEPTLRQILLTDVPYGAKAQLLNVRASTGWSSQEYEPFFQQAIKQASDIFYKNKLNSLGEGGTIPLMGLLQKVWPGRQFLITGVLGPHSNAHGPNEFLHIDYVKKLTCCLAYVVAKCTQHLTK